jgi:hypothetical protein
LFYDAHGKLFAMRRDTEVYYIALDPTDSPIVVLNGVGSVVKQIDYDPLGAQIGDSAQDFVLPVSFRCGVVDRSSRLVVFVDGRAYDPSVGRWMVPDYDHLVDSVDQLAAFPELTNLYRAVMWKQSGASSSFMTDVPDWLSELGFDFGQLLPKVNQGVVHVGHRRLTTGESPVVVSTDSLIECAFEHATQKFGRLSLVRRSKVVSPPAPEWPMIGQTVAPVPGIFGQGVVVSGRRVSVVILETAAESELAILATTLLNGSEAVDLPFTVHGRDVHHFVHETLERASRDLQLLGLRPDISAVVAGVNMTIHRHRRSATDTSDDDDDEYVEVRLHSERTWVTVRYGGISAAAERERILKRAARRAADTAWAVERERAQSGKRSINTWTRREVDELLSRGQVNGFRAVYVRDVGEFPELADDPHNVRFVPN